MLSTRLSHAMKVTVALLAFLWGMAGVAHAGDDPLTVDVFFGEVVNTFSSSNNVQGDSSDASKVKLLGGLEFDLRSLETWNDRHRNWGLRVDLFGQFIHSMRTAEKDTSTSAAASAAPGKTFEVIRHATAIEWFSGVKIAFLRLNRYDGDDAGNDEYYTHVYLKWHCGFVQFRQRSDDIADLNFIGVGLEQMK